MIPRLDLDQHPPSQAKHADEPQEANSDDVIASVPWDSYTPSEFPAEFSAVSSCVQSLMKLKSADIFLDPVTDDVLPNYASQLFQMGGRTPIDFNTIASNVLDDKYPHAKALILDVLRIFENAEAFWGDTQPTVTRPAQLCRKRFLKDLAKIASRITNPNILPTPSANSQKLSVWHRGPLPPLKTYGRARPICGQCRTTANSYGWSLCDHLADVVAIAMVSLDADGPASAASPADLGGSASGLEREPLEPPAVRRLRCDDAQAPEGCASSTADPVAESRPAGKFGWVYDPAEGRVVYQYPCMEELPAADQHGPPPTFPAPHLAKVETSDPDYPAALDVHSPLQPLPMRTSTAVDGSNNKVTALDFVLPRDFPIAPYGQVVATPPEPALYRDTTGGWISHSFWYRMPHPEPHLLAATPIDFLVRWSGGDITQDPMWAALPKTGELCGTPIA